MKDFCNCVLFSALFLVGLKGDVRPFYTHQSEFKVRLYFTGLLFPNNLQEKFPVKNLKELLHST